MRALPLTELEASIGHRFKDQALLEVALTHSTAGEGNAVDDNRRLAFLGDAVIELAVRADVYQDHLMAKRGDLSVDTDKQVKDTVLAMQARRLGLQDWLRVGKGEARNRSGEDRRLADAFEALAGALYLDAGAKAFPVVLRLMALKGPDESPP